MSRPGPDPENEAARRRLLRDPRFEALLLGTLSDDDRQALETEAETSEVVATGLRLFTPPSESEVDASLDRLHAAREARGDFADLSGLADLAEKPAAAPPTPRGNPAKAMKAPWTTRWGNVLSPLMAAAIAVFGYRIIEEQGASSTDPDATVKVGWSMRSAAVDPSRTTRGPGDEVVDVDVDVPIDATSPGQTQITLSPQPRPYEHLTVAAFLVRGDRVEPWAFPAGSVNPSDDGVLTITAPTNQLFAGIESGPWTAVFTLTRAHGLARTGAGADDPLTWYVVRKELVIQARPDAAP